MTTVLLTLVLVLLAPGDGTNCGAFGCEGRPRASYKTGFTKYPRADAAGFYGGFGRTPKVSRAL